MKRIISNVAVVDPRRLRMWYHGMVVAFALSFLLAFKWEYELSTGCFLSKGSVCSMFLMVIIYCETRYL
ncbi:hypothetical protein C8Q69DRAFT_473572 [Paecilomyces variotii]|uniref:Uncharacterized protein n=1 Tax=Byssochlamys spectabilis TaxID=264951 RepID=A0A443HNV7_BYSSP|nr:hypothetical protein C8Q69DRAFT_473572 [Paecilomyces variotii]RWQ93444.1 hypothetical protein C8Q69DRAFT_473572 [Paecilomyces variotii]